MADLKAKSANPIEMISGKHESKQCGGNSWLKNIGGGTGNEDAAGQSDKKKTSMGYQEYNHPPIIGKFMNYGERFDTRMHNKFLKQLYLKYPSILPKDLPKDDFEFGINLKFQGLRSDITTYRCDYGDMKEEPTPDLYRAAGLHRKEQFEEAVPPMNPLYFQSGGRHPISAIKEPCKRRPRVTEEASMSREKSEADQYGKNQSEYDQNINGLAKYFYKNKIYTKPFVFVRTLSTLRK